MRISKERHEYLKTILNAKELELFEKSKVTNTIKFDCGSMYSFQTCDLGEEDLVDTENEDFYIYRSSNTRLYVVATYFESLPDAESFADAIHRPQQEI